jgi:pimeloyl-ACP methyl ester carboxylesterase/predicted glycosyltransferase
MYAENKGVKIWYEIHGQGEPTLIMVPGFQIVHSEYYKRFCVPFLSRHMRVVTLDLRGSGKSDGPEGGYDLENWTDDIHAVVQDAGLDVFAMAGSSCGVSMCINYCTNHPAKVSHLILMNGFARMVRSESYPAGMPEKDLKGIVQFWHDQPQDMLKGFIEMLCSEKYTLRAKELVWQWAHETSPAIWAKGFSCSVQTNVDATLENLDLPVLIVAGQTDQVVFPSASEYLHQKIRGSRFIPIEHAGHGFLRTWPQAGRHILNFLKPETASPGPAPVQEAGVRILWISSPIGLGHVKRDLAIADAMRKQRPDLSIHWLAMDPVKTFLEDSGERIHPLSQFMRDESGRFESHGTASYSLNATEAYWEMDKLLNNNFMVFTDVLNESAYDLVVGDESWEVLDNLHYNPSLKKAPFVFMTDFVGMTNVSQDQTKQDHVYNLNGSWVEKWEVHPEATDLAVFIGNQDDIPDTPFDAGLPNRRQWANEHFEFSGYVLPFDPAEYSDRQRVRDGLGFSSDDKILLVAVGGTSVGRPLIEKCLAAQPALQDAIPGIRTIVMCGPRIDIASFENYENVEFKSFVSEPVKLYAACDLAVIQGGLATAMELTALNRSFLYFPLKEHFEQQDFVSYRLEGYQAGMRMGFDATDPEKLAETIAANIGKPVNYQPVETDGAQKAASMILGLLNKGDSKCD